MLNGVTKKQKTPALFRNVYLQIVQVIGKLDIMYAVNASFSGTFSYLLRIRYPLLTCLVRSIPAA